MARPWANRRDRAQLFKFSGSNWYSQSDQRVDLTSLSSSSILVLADAEEVIQMPIANDLRDLPDKEIVSKMLPFGDDELYYSIDHEAQLCFALPRKSVAFAAESLITAGHRFAGIGFLDQQAKLHVASVDSNELERLSDRNIAFKSIWASIGIGVLFVAGFVFYELTTQGSRQAEFQSQLVEAEQIMPISLPIETMTELADALNKVSVRDGKSAMLLLSEVLKALSNDVEIQQLGVTNNELVIDATAQNAIKLKAALSQSPMFSDVEFVSSISSNGNTGVERFRLRAELASYPLNLAETRSDNSMSDPPKPSRNKVDES